MSKRPTDSAARSEKALGERSRSVIAHAVHLSVTVTVIDLPLSEKRKSVKVINGIKALTGEGDLLVADRVGIGVDTIVASVGE